METFDHSGEEQSKQNKNKKDLINTLKTDTITFSCTADFSGLDYETQVNKVNNILDGIDAFLLKQPIKGSDGLFVLLHEIIRNSADHGQSDVYIHIDLTKNSEKTVEIKFSIYDKGPGISYKESEIKNIFDHGESFPDRKKKGKHNAGVGLGMIKAISETRNIQLTLHNQGKKISIFGTDTIPKKNNEYTFGYDGVGTFDIMK